MPGYGPVDGLTQLLSGQPNSSGYRPIISESIFNAITPRSYAGKSGQILDALSRIGAGDPGVRTRDPALFSDMSEDDIKAREDAWRIYLGLPQKHSVFRPAQYAPTRAKNNGIEYLSIDEDALLGRLSRQFGSDPIPVLLDKIARNKGKPIVLEDMSGRWLGGQPHALGHFTVDSGADARGPYLSYYDKWDLDTPLAKIANVGKPFEVYGRIYYLEKPPFKK